MKKKLYEVLIERMEIAETNGRDAEAAWFAYAVLEDRLRSLLRQSGGEGEKRGVGKPIRMMGPKIAELSKRAKKDSLLKDCFEYTRLNQWKHDRNNLVHAMADGEHDIEEIDKLTAALASVGVELVRIYATAARRLKKNCGKVTLPSL